MNPDPRDQQAVYDCAASDRLQLDRLTCKKARDFYLARLRRAGLSKGRAQQYLPSCEMLAAVARDLTGKPAWWEGCLGFPGGFNEEHFRRCLGDHGDTSSCTAAKRSYDRGLAAADPFDTPPVPYDAPSCELVTAALAAPEPEPETGESTQAPDGGTGRGTRSAAPRRTSSPAWAKCQGYERESMIAHMKSCLGPDYRRFDSCEEVQRRYRDNIRAAYDGLPADFTLPTCGEAGTILALAAEQIEADRRAVEERRAQIEEQRRRAEETRRRAMLEEQRRRDLESRRSADDGSGDVVAIGIAFIITLIWLGGVIRTWRPEIVPGRRLDQPGDFWTAALFLEEATAGPVYRVCFKNREVRETRGIAGGLWKVFVAFPLALFGAFGTLLMFLRIPEFIGTPGTVIAMAANVLNGGEGAGPDAWTLTGPVGLLLLYRLAFPVRRRRIELDYGSGQMRIMKAGKVEAVLPVEFETLTIEEHPEAVLEKIERTINNRKGPGLKEKQHCLVGRFGYGGGNESILLCRFEWPNRGSLREVQQALYFAQEHARETGQASSDTEPRRSGTPAAWSNMPPLD